MFFCTLFIFVWIIPMIIEWIGSIDWTGKLDNPENNPYYKPPGWASREIKTYDFKEENRKILERMGK